MARMVRDIPDIEVFCIGKCSVQLARKMIDIVGHEYNRLHIDGIGSYTLYEKILETYSVKEWLAGLALFHPMAIYMKSEPTKIFEYMAAGLPVICSDFPKWNHLMHNCKVGITVNPYDIAEIREAIDQLFLNSELRNEMVNNGPLAVSSELNWKSEEKKLFGFYNKILNQ